MSENWKSTIRDWLKFNAVGIMGTVLQLSGLWILTGLVRWPHYLIATGISVEAAIIHNFIWHTKWTWADRMSASLLDRITALLRFNLTTGALSIFGNVVLMRVIVGVFGLNVLVANLAAIVCCSLLNFIISDRFVFVESEMKQASTVPN